MESKLEEKKSLQSAEFNLIHIKLSFLFDVHMTILTRLNYCDFILKNAQHLILKQKKNKIL